MRQNFPAFVLILVACSSGGPTGPVGSTGSGTFTATIDGSSWVSTTNQVTIGGSGSNAVPGYLLITGTQVQSATNYTTVFLSLGYLGGTGTYPLGVNPGTTAGGSGNVSAPQGASFGTWSTNLTGTGGTVTVTSLTSSRIVGTFQFTAPPQSFSQTTGTRVVTNGAFDMPLPAGFTPAPPDNNGSRISALINGSPWNGATVTALGSGNVFTVGGLTDSLSISITPGTVVSAGSTYPIGGSGGGTMTAVRFGVSGTWTSATGASVGTLTVTSIGGGRAAGTFSATLVPGASTVGSLVITQGTFNVRILSQ